MAIGRVGYSGRTTSELAPNSPSETVKANTAADRVARATIGQSTANQTRCEEAPSEAAACRSRSGMEARAGCKLRMTNGRAISVCASGTSSGEVTKRQRRAIERDDKPQPQRYSGSAKGQHQERVKEALEAPGTSQGRRDGKTERQGKDNGQHRHNQGNCQSP